MKPEQRKSKFEFLKNDGNWFKIIHSPKFGIRILKYLESKFLLINKIIDRKKNSIYTSIWVYGCLNIFWEKRFTSQDGQPPIAVKGEMG